MTFDSTPTDLPATDATASTAHYESGQGSIVNYAWYSRYSDADIALKSVFNVMAPHDLAKILINANRYPDVEFRLWIDSQRAAPNTMACLQDFFDQASQHQNIEVYDAQTIPTYGDITASAFNTTQTQENKLWRFVDILKLAITEHCYETTNANNIFFADLDIDDVMVESAQTLDSLEAYGFVTGGFHRSDRSASKSDYIENSFMGFRGEKGLSLLSEMINFTFQQYSNPSTVNGYVPYTLVIASRLPRENSRDFIIQNVQRTRFKETETRIQELLHEAGIQDLVTHQSPGVTDPQ